MKYSIFLSCAIVFCSLVYSCKKKDDTLVDPGKTYTHLLSGSRRFTGTDYENWPGINMTYAIDTNLSITCLNDSTIIVRNDTLHYTVGDINVSTYEKSVYGSFTINYVEIEHYHNGDSVHYHYSYSYGHAYNGSIVNLRSQ